jgi:hypothetical protein
MWSAKAQAKRRIPLGSNRIEKNCEITITKGIKHEYAIWTPHGIYDLPKRYVKNIKVLTKN